MYDKEFMKHMPYYILTTTCIVYIIFDIAAIFQEKIDQNVKEKSSTLSRPTIFG